MASKEQSPTSKITLVASSEKEPSVRVKAGTKVELVEIETVYLDAETPKHVLGTLCGYSSTYCVALIEAK